MNPIEKKVAAEMRCIKFSGSPNLARRPEIVIINKKKELVFW